MRRKAATRIAERKEPGQQQTVPDPDITLPPEARPVPGRPYYRYTFAKSGTHVDVDALYDEARRRRQLAEILRLEKDNIERGMKFGTNKLPRGRSRLYREAEAVLERDGRDTPAKAVLTDLERRGVVAVTKKMMMRWRDDADRPKRTTFAQFEKQISKIRGDVRR